MVYTPENGGEKVVMNVYEFKGKGVACSFFPCFSLFSEGGG